MQVSQEKITKSSHLTFQLPQIGAFANAFGTTTKVVSLWLTGHSPSFFQYARIENILLHLGIEQGYTFSPLLWSEGWWIREPSYIQDGAYSSLQGALTGNITLRVQPADDASRYQTVPVLLSSQIRSDVHTYMHIPHRFFSCVLLGAVNCETQWTPACNIGNWWSSNCARKEGDVQVFPFPDA